MRDYQRQRVYDWENAVIRPRCKGVVLFKNSQQYIDGVWLACGWERPPKTLSMPRRVRKVTASATHGWIKLPNEISAWVILHELAHSLTDDGHGPNFVGMYIDLLERVEKISKLMTMYTLDQAKIDYNLGAKPLEWVVRRT